MPRLRQIHIFHKRLRRKCWQITLTHLFNLLDLWIAEDCLITWGLSLLLSSNSATVEHSFLNGSRYWWFSQSLDFRSLTAALTEVLVKNMYVFVVVLFLCFCHIPSKSDSGRWEPGISIFNKFFRNFSCSVKLENHWWCASFSLTVF